MTNTAAVNTVDISVIIGAQNARESIRDCLKALSTLPAGLNVEIIVVDGSTDDTAQIVRQEFPRVKLIEAKPSALVPHLWKTGLDAAQGRIIAFTIGQCIPSEGWLTEIQMASQSDWAGVGGPLDGPTTGRSVDWALYFARYSAYLPPGPRGEVPEIPGDNAAYQRAMLDQCIRETQDGFWETLVHVRLHALGYKLAMLPEMRVRLGATPSLGTTLRARFRHGRHYGSTRPGNTPVKRLLRLVAAPLILPTLVSRIRRRVQQQKPEWLPHLTRALPPLILILGAWTLGEISGYLSPAKSASAQS